MNRRVETPWQQSQQSYARRAIADAAYKVPPRVDSRRLDQFVMRVGRPVPVVLVAGTSTGAVCAELDRLGASSFGIQPEPASLSLARAQYPGGNLQAGDLRAMQFARSSFDGAVLGSSLFRMPREESRAALAEVHRVLRMGALLSVDLIVGDMDGLQDTPFGPMYACGWTERAFAEACDVLDMQLLESLHLSEGTRAMLFRREY